MGGDDDIGRFPCPYRCGYQIRIIAVERPLFAGEAVRVRLDERDWNIHMRYSHQVQDGGQ